MKRKTIVSIICLSTLLALCGCEGDRRDGKQDGDDNPSLTVEDSVKTESGSDEDALSENAQFQGEKTWKVNIYYIDDNSGNVTSKIIEVENERDIWEALQETNILTAECKMLSFSMNEEEKTIDLDFNKALGERIRSMGTSGETEIIGCLVNTFLDAYDCEKIKLTEEGAEFETGHGAEYNGYVDKIEF